VYSETGRGAGFALAVPTTLQMISAFIVRAGRWRYAVNVGQIVELFYAAEGDIANNGNRPKVRWRDGKIPLVELQRVLFPEREPDSQTPSGRFPALVTRVLERPIAVHVSQFEDQREIIVKSLGTLSRRFRGIIGAVDLEGGDVALVLDLPSLLIPRLTSL
jgi:two-component system chemotaxis sensor kinase CheA